MDEADTSAGRLLGLGTEGGQARKISLRLARGLNSDAGEVPGRLILCGEDLEMSEGNSEKC